VIEKKNLFKEEDMKKVFVIILVLLLASTVLWAASQQEEEGETTQQLDPTLENSWESFKDDPIVLEVFADSPNALFTEHLSEATLLIPRVMKEETGVTLNVRQAVDSSDQSLNLIIASGSYPDLMIVNTDRQVAAALIENDQIWSFEDLEARYGVDTISHMNVNQRFSLRSKFDNDKIYYLTAYGWHDEHSDSPWIVKWQSGTYVNEKWYKAVGSPPINSFDDLMETAKKMRDANPRMEYPFIVHRSTGTGHFNEPAEVVRLKQYYGLNDPTTYWKLGETHKFIIQAPAFLDLVKDLNRMEHEELFNPIIWTGSKNDKLGLVFNGLPAFVLNGDADNLAQRNTALQEKYPDERWIMLPPFPADPTKYRYTTTGSVGAGGDNGWTIPKTGKNDLRRLAFVDYIMSDHFQKLNAFGREGYEHEIVDGVPVFKSPFAEMGRAELRDQYGFNILGGMIRDDYWDMIRRQQQAPEMLEAINTLRPAIDNFKDLTFVPEAVEISYPADSEELKIYSQIKETFGDELLKIILNSPPERVEADYAALLAKVENMGIAKLNAFQQQAAESFQQNVQKYKK
jgi:putative aldouronate transport system substrate-binding protein